MIYYSNGSQGYTPRNEWIVSKTTKTFPTYALILEYMLLGGINLKLKRLIIKFQTPLITTKMSVEVIPLLLNLT
jgi:hypothetical protein